MLSKVRVFIFKVNHFSLSLSHTHTHTLRLDLSCNTLSPNQCTYQMVPSLSVTVDMLCKSPLLTHPPAPKAPKPFYCLIVSLGSSPGEPLHMHTYTRTHTHTHTCTYKIIHTHTDKTTHTHTCTENRNRKVTR